MIYLGVIGGRLCEPKEADAAYHVGAAVGRAGAVLVCGGMGGVMEHACRGAQENGGVTIGILPMEERRGANPYLTYSIPTGFAEARNIIVVRSSDGIVAIGGSYGTLSEIAFAGLQKKPMAGILTWRAKDPAGKELPLFTTDDPEEAVQRVLTQLKRNS